VEGSRVHPTDPTREPEARLSASLPWMNGQGPSPAPGGTRPPSGGGPAEGIFGPSDLIHADKVASAEKTSTYDSPSEGIAERLERYSPARKRAAGMRDYLAELAALGHLLPAHLGNRADVEYRAGKLERCGCWLLLRDYFTLGQTRLVDGRFCNQPLLCPLCAIRRGSKLLRAYVEKLATVLYECQGRYGAFLITLTVRDGVDLGERFKHLRRSLWVLNERRRKFQNRQSKQWTEAARALAGVGFLEFKRGRGSGQWHPHYHGGWVCSEAPDAAALSREWLAITGDSFIVDVRPFRSMGQLGGCPTAEWPQLLASDFVELAKYALKFSDLSLADNWEAFRLLSGRRLVDAFGWLRGVEVDPSLTDEPVEDGDAPYFEILARHLAGSYVQSSRRLVMPEDERAAAVELDAGQAAAVAAAEVSFFR